MTNFYDAQGAQRDAAWFADAYHAEVRVADAPFKFTLARVDCLTDQHVITVRVIDQQGAPINHQQVAISWPDDTLSKFSPAYKRRWGERGRAQYTGSDGYTGFGLSGNSSDYATKPPAGGPYAFWVLALSADSDGLVCVGVAPDGTGPFALTFALTGTEPVVVPPVVPPVMPPVVPPVVPPTPGISFTARVKHYLHCIPRHWADIDRVRFQTLAADWVKIVTDDDTIPHVDSIPSTANVLVRNYPLSEQWDRDADKTPFAKRYFVDATEAYSRGLAHAAWCERIAQWAEQHGVQRSRLYFEGINEPEFWSGEPPALTAAYYEAFVVGCRSHGIGTCVLNAGVGWPGTISSDPQTAVDWAPFERLHQAMGPRDYLGLHQYFGMAGPDASWPDGKLRWASEAGRHLQCPWTDVKILLTEHGLDDGVNQHPKSGWHDIVANSFDTKVVAYMDMLRWCWRQYVADGRVAGAFVFTYDYASNDWEKFSIRHDPFMAAYQKWIAEGETMTTWGDGRTARWEPLVSKYAAAFGLDPRVVGTVIAIESAGRVDASSSVGAVGLMQVMPDTAIAGRPTRAWLLEPDNNINYGCGVLRGYLGYYHGDMAYALAAYNAGPGNVDKYGLEWAAPRVYLGMFVKAWAALWPGVPCPVTVAGVPVDDSLRVALLAAGEAHQVIQFNPSAALQKRIFADGFVPNSGEFSLDVNGVSYTGQRGERLDTGAVRVYYARTGGWANVMFAER